MISPLVALFIIISDRQDFQPSGLITNCDFGHGWNQFLPLLDEFSPNQDFVFPVNSELF